ncbi:MAG: hypothetical protein H0X66_16255 [Verrucomicrobia bacterium]|nr:hypothetical protein [Verrucomicrobiota bacterium]
METRKLREMDPEIETKHSTAVEMAVQCIYRTIFPQGDQTFVATAFNWALSCFSGNYRDYGPIDAKYHDLEHTLQGTLCFCRMLHGRHVAGAQPALTQRMFELGVLAILLHDTGYLKSRDDTEGTGAKYTMVHVNRSIDFSGILLEEKQLAPAEINAVQNMIRCTGVSVAIQSIPFENELERQVGFCLGTADLLGQMAAPDYVDKLPILYSEFEESAQYNAGRGSATGIFGSVRDLMVKTPLFWEGYVFPKVNGDFAGMYKFLNVPYPDGGNFYLRRIEANIARVKAKLAEGE